MPTIDQVDRAIASIVKPAERLIVSAYRKALDDVRAHLGKLYERYAKAGELTYAEMSRYNRLTALHVQLRDILGPTLSANGRTVKKLVKVVYEETYYRMGWMLTTNVEVAGKWGLVAPDLVSAAINKPYSGLKLDEVLNRAFGAARMDIERAVVQGMVQGDSYPNMAKRVRGAFETNAQRALTIAQTEGHRAQVEAQKASYDRAAKMGIEVQQVWDATLDGRTRESHQQMDGKAAKEVSEGVWQFYMPSQRAWVDGPGLTGYASEDINCRCRITPRIKDAEPGSRIARDRTERNVIVRGDMKYPEWADAMGVK